ncbi:MAG: Trk system potassium transporter TrkA [Planctomycetota bacterium]|nr:Trk system potassium transporter TrkA [Planctomycetota bacterium]
MLRIVIVGAGVVGFHLAERLSAEGYRVTVVDANPDLIHRIDDRLNVRAIHGNAASPRTLRQAIADNTDLVIAVTDRDETNIVVSLISKQLGAKKVVVRLRNSELSSKTSPLLKEAYGADLIVNPVDATAEKLRRLVQNPGTFDVFDFADGEMVLWGYQISEGSPLDGVVLRDLRRRYDRIPGLIVGISREDGLVIATGDDELRDGDQIYVLLQRTKTAEFRAIAHPGTEVVQQVFIAGATQLGIEVARRLEGSVKSVVLVEKDRARAERASEILEKSLVLHGDIEDADFAEENRVGDADFFLSLENGDAENLTNALLVNKLGVRRILIRTEQSQFLPILKQAAVGEAVNPRRITVSAILRELRRGRVIAVSQVGDSGAEAREYEISEAESVCGKKIRDLGRTKDFIIGAIQRGDEVFTAEGDTVIENGDHVIVFALPGAVNDIEKLFTRRRGKLK